jgi:hypothetical protein
MKTEMGRWVIIVPIDRYCFIVLPLGLKKIKGIKPLILKKPFQLFKPEYVAYPYPYGTHLKY